MFLYRSVTVPKGNCNSKPLRDGGKKKWQYSQDAPRIWFTFYIVFHLRHLQIMLHVIFPMGYSIFSYVLLRFAHLEAELDLTHSDQRRVLHILWCIAEKERIENLQDVVSWSKSVCFHSV